MLGSPCSPRLLHSTALVVQFPLDSGSWPFSSSGGPADAASTSARAPADAASTSAGGPADAASTSAGGPSDVALTSAVVLRTRLDPSFRRFRLIQFAGPNATTFTSHTPLRILPTLELLLTKLDLA